MIKEDGGLDPRGNRVADVAADLGREVAPARQTRSSGAGEIDLSPSAFGLARAARNYLMPYCSLLMALLASVSS